MKNRPPKARATTPPIPSPYPHHPLISYSYTLRLCERLDIYISTSQYCDMNYMAGLFRVLGDTARLRMLRLLAKEKLNVSELTAILGSAQSGVSRNLKLLKDAGLLQEQREGGWAYYSVDPAVLPEDAAGIWPLLQRKLAEMSVAHEDNARLEEVRRQRHEEFREPAGRGIYPGRSWAAWARTLSYLTPPCTVADLGCGEGYLTLEVSRWAQKVTGIDHSRRMLQKASQLARKKEARNIAWKYGKLEKVPLKDRSMDVVMMAQVLHCVKDPSVALKEAHRILIPGGRLLIQELRSHQEKWVQERFGDVRLGFDERELLRLLKQAGFSRIKLEIGARRHGDPFTVLIGCGRRGGFETRPYRDVL